MNDANFCLNYQNPSRMTNIYTIRRSKFDVGWVYGCFYDS